MVPFRAFAEVSRALSETSLSLIFRRPAHHSYLTLTPPASSHKSPKMVATYAIAGRQVGSHHVSARKQQDGRSVLTTLFFSSSLSQFSQQSESALVMLPQERRLTRLLDHQSTPQAKTRVTSFSKKIQLLTRNVANRHIRNFLKQAEGGEKAKH